MSAPSDQAQRDRFCGELNRNFSVIAAAGSGKTRAITDRIAQIAQSPHALEWLPAMVVVTFTHRAADEMQRRARQKILQDRVSLDVVAAFNRAFFGTIHSFCVKLLAEYGHYLGLPPHLALITDDDELWHNFVQSQASIGRNLNAESRCILLRHVPVRQLMELGRAGNASLPQTNDLGACPDLDFDAVYAFSPARYSEKIERGQADLREWERQFRAGTDFLPLIDCPTTAREFVPLWDEAFGPFRRWLNCSALAVAADVQNAYREYRLDHGVLTYDDQIRLADALLQQPTAAGRIRERNFRVVLDEAQDTDPEQFSILLEIARPPQASGRWLETRVDPPRPGFFCMVGDFQQSIFGDRADLARYRRIHETLLQTGAGEEVELAVTFRLDQRQVDFMNKAFPCLLNDTDGQVGFVELNARPAVLPGQIVALKINGTDGDEKQSERLKADSEARQIAAWLKTTGLERLRARSWSEVAILCPRKTWFTPLRQALRQAGFAVQTQSESELNADNPAHAWLTALATIMAKPHLFYETVGVLREVFGISDDALARFSNGNGERFDFLRPVDGEEGDVAAALRVLSKLRHAVRAAPLYTAVCHIADGVRLRARLASLPAHDYGDLATELDRLLVAAAAAEAEGKTLADFARDLRANFDAPRDSEPPQRDSIQLITGQKAKGSEWDAVVIPFLCREVRTRSSDYARIIRTPQTGELVVALGRDDMSKEVKEALKLAERQEMERLLYVALTRARHSLVIAVDDRLFHTTQGVAPKNSQARWLRSAAAEMNGELFQELAAEAKACASTWESQEREELRRQSEQTLPALPQGGPDFLRDGSREADKFVRKLTPSRIDPTTGDPSGNDADVWKETEPELRPLAVDGAAKRYGIWWHEFAQRIPWNEDPDLAEAVFAQFQMHSPDPARSLREWELLRKQRAQTGSVPQTLARTGALWQNELPFLWPIDNQRSVEGIIDLAVFDHEAKRAFIIDWKTNRIPVEESENLRAEYLPQIAAYAQAISRLTAMTVEAAIYSTAIGRFLPYKADELNQEWERLRQFPRQDLVFEKTGKEVRQDPSPSSQARDNTA